MNTEELVALSLIDGVGEKTLKNLDKFDSIEDIKKLPDSELKKCFANAVSERLFREKTDIYRKKAEYCVKILEKSDAKIIKNTSPQYPQRMLNTEKSPVFIYCRGNTELLNHPSTAAISGPRKASPDGLRSAFSTAKSLCSEDTVIISGLALGVDSEAHKAACQFGKTIAVLPFYSPVYPPQNVSLYNEILASGGLVISEYFDSSNIKFKLLNRDKIIVELADELYIPDIYVEDSGTAYTVKYAQQRNKKIYYKPRQRFIRI